MNVTAHLAELYPVNILVSDNDPAYRQEAIKILTDWGYVPKEVVADTSLHALAETGRYDVILLNFRPAASATADALSKNVTESRPLLIGISRLTKGDLTFPIESAGSKVLIFRPTTREELKEYLKFCSIHAGKHAII